MENLALISSKFPIPSSLNRRQLGPNRTVFCELRRGISDGDSLRASKSVVENLEIKSFASISSSTINSTPPIPVSCSPSSIGSPILWIGVGVGLSALFSVVATKLKRQAILHAFKTVMSQDAPQNGQFNTAAFSPGSQFPFPAASSPSAPTTSPQTPVTPLPAVDADESPTKAEGVLAADVKNVTEEVKEAMNPESNALHLKEPQVSSEPPTTLDAPGTEVEATPPATPTTTVEAVSPASFEDN